MAADDITVNAKIATIECDATDHRITIDAAGGSLTNVGGSSVFLSMNNEGDDLNRDGLQHQGEVRLDPDDTIDLPADVLFIRNQCAAGQTSALWFVPRLG